MLSFLTHDWYKKIYQYVLYICICRRIYCKALVSSKVCCAYMPSLFWSMIRNRIQWFYVKTYLKWNPNNHRNDSHCEREFYLKKVQFKAQRLLDPRESRAQLSQDRHFSQFLCILVDEWQIGPKSLVMKNSGNGPPDLRFVLEFTRPDFRSKNFTH